MQSIRVRSYAVEPATAVSWLNASDAAVLNIAGKTAGLLGSLAPAIEDKYKLKQPVYLAEIDFEQLAQHAFAPLSYESLPRFPLVERDMSIVVSRSVAYQAIRGGITGLGIPELTRIDLIDVYEGEKIPSGSVSLTLRLAFQDREKTLTVDRVQDFVDTVLAFLNKSYGAGLRSL